MSHASKAHKRDGRDVEISFSTPLKDGFADLEAAVHFSEHFEPDIRAILQTWAKGESQTLHDIMIAFPAIAEETFRHIHATKDERAQDAWDQIRIQLAERGFSVSSVQRKR